MSLIHLPLLLIVLNTTATLLHTSRLPSGTTRAQALAMLSDHEFFLSCDPLLSKFESIPHDTSTPYSVPERVSSNLRYTASTSATASASRPITTTKNSSDAALSSSEVAHSSKEGAAATTTTTTVPATTSDESKNIGQEGGGGVVPTCYRVTDIVHAIPAGIWDTNVVSTYEFVDVQDGVFVRIRSPLSVVMETFWEVRAVDAKENGDGGEKGLELVEDVTIRCSRLLVGLVKKECENGWEGIHAKMYKRLEDVRDGKV